MLLTQLLYYNFRLQKVGIVSNTFLPNAAIRRPCGGGS